MEKKHEWDKISAYITCHPNARRAFARSSHFGFFYIYLSPYRIYKTADFQRQMFELTQDDTKNRIVIAAFRGSAKSTIVSLSYIIWAMITGKKKHIVILSQTQQLSRLMFANLRKEFEENSLLVSDFGPFKTSPDEWNASSITIASYNCRITCISCGESIRGIKHRQYRPDLIICDDVESLVSVRTKEGRDKTYNWLTREVIPAGDKNTKVIIVGNMLHEDSLMARLKKAIEVGNFSAIYRQFPLLDDNGLCAWPQKFKTDEEIDNLKTSVGSDTAWQREYLLKVVPEEDAVVLQEWISYYDRLPVSDKEFRYIATGIDLAISQSASADYTAMVSAYVSGYNEDLKIYILSHPINKRMNFPDTLKTAKDLSITLGNSNSTYLFIEDVGYQASIIQELAYQGFPAESVKTGGQDKRARLSSITHLIKAGKILFPLKGCEQLITQLTGFGYEVHDDLADAFTILITRVLKDSYVKEILIGRA